MFMQIFIPLRLFTLQFAPPKVCSLGKSSKFCSLTSPIGKSFCLPFPWRKSGTNFCYCLRQFAITRQAACLRQEETLPQGPISGNFSPMIIGLNGSIFTPVAWLYCIFLPHKWHSWYFSGCTLVWKLFSANLTRAQILQSKSSVG